MTDTKILTGVTAPIKSNPFRLLKGDTLSIRSSTSHSITIYSNPISPYSSSNDNIVQTVSTNVDLVSPSESILVLDVTAVSGTLEAIIIRSEEND